MECHVDTSTHLTISQQANKPPALVAGNFPQSIQESIGFPISPGVYNPSGSPPPWHGVFCHLPGNYLTMTTGL